MNLLVSFCNTPDYRKQVRAGLSPLALVDTQRGEVFWLPLPREAGITGITGLAANRGFIFAAYQVNKFLPAPVRRYGVLVFEKSTLELKSWHRLKEIADPHTLLIRGEELVITSTGNDRVISYPCRGSKIDLTSAATLWLPSGSGGRKDTHHLNSICFLNGSLLVSAFGLRTGRFWKSARSGYIFDITRGRVLSEQLSHPHSLLGEGSDLFFCESAAGRVKKNGETLYEFGGGYTRGLAKVGDTLIVGRSQTRQVSRSTGLVSHREKSDSPADCCALSLIDLATNRLVTAINLSSFHDEIFDILPVGAVVPKGLSRRALLPKVVIR